LIRAAFADKRISLLNNTELFRIEQLDPKHGAVRMNIKNAAQFYQVGLHGPTLLIVSNLFRILYDPCTLEFASNFGTFSYP